MDIDRFCTSCPTMRRCIECAGRARDVSPAAAACARSHRPARAEAVKKCLRCRSWPCQRGSHLPVGVLKLQWLTECRSLAFWASDKRNHSKQFCHRHLVREELPRQAVSKQRLRQQASFGLRADVKSCQTTMPYHASAHSFEDPCVNICMRRR